MPVGDGAALAVEAGYTSLRTQPMFRGFEQKRASQVIADAVAIVAAIREAVGPEIDLGVEIHRNLELGDAVVLGNELKPYRLLYYEDPLRPQSTQALTYLAEPIPRPQDQRQLPGRRLGRALTRQGRPIYAR